MGTRLDPIGCPGDLIEIPATGMNETLFELPRVPFIQGHRHTVRATEGPISQTTNHQLEIMSEPERGNFKSVRGRLYFF
ncbi:hypothetical protein AtubIFM55763_005196 [Aspergillus tubingensis]|nr:hypothetical protein AtubIFM55763_005196 [Aspergillus tubingensis]